MRWQKVGTLIATVLIVVIAAGILFPICAEHAVLGLDLQGELRFVWKRRTEPRKRIWKQQKV